MSYGSWALGFGISFWQAFIVSMIGIVFLFFLCGVIAIAGKRASAPTMVLSRAAFGVHGQKLPGIVSWLTSIGWETFLAITAVLATATVFETLGLGAGTSLTIMAALLVAAVIVIASVLGYHTIMKMQGILTWFTGVVTIIYLVLVLVLPKIDLQAVFSMEAGSIQQTVGAMVMVMTGLGLGWINIAADWSRYQSRDTSDGSIIFWNTFGGSAAPIILITIGLLLAGSDPALVDGIAVDPVGTLTLLLPTWAIIAFWLTALLSLISGAVLGIYSSGLTLLSLGINIPRPIAAGVDGLILTIGTIWVVFFAQDFLGPFQSFLLTLGVPLAAWAGIFIADILRRKTGYHEPSLFDPNGVYRAWDLTSLITFVGVSIIGWGLVINQFAAEAAWNNWQGYLLGPLGGKDGDWAYTNLGVLVALVLGFVITYFARATTIRRQEANAPAQEIA